jgi:hypothetical protein
MLIDDKRARKVAHLGHSYQSAIDQKDTTAGQRNQV